MVDREFFLGFIKIHVLYHASKGPVFGAEITDELGRHGYHLGPGTLYPTLHRLEKEGYRKAVVKNYIIVYKVDEDAKKVSILRFFYGAQDYNKLI